MIGQAAADYVTSLLARYKTDRRTMEIEMDMLMAALISDDRFKTKWKEGEAAPDETGKTEGRSRLVTDFVRQKVLAALGQIADPVLSGGRLSFMLIDDSLPMERNILSRLPGLAPEIQQRLDAIAQHERLLHRQTEDGKAIEEVLTAILECVLLGVSYVKYLELCVKMPKLMDANGELSFEREECWIPGVRHVSAYNLFYDLVAGWEKSPARIEVQRLNLNELAAMAEEPGIIAENLEKALESKTQEMVDQSEEPSHRGIWAIHQPRKIAEFWGMMPRKRVEQAMAGKEDIGYTPADFAKGGSFAGTDSAPEMRDMVRVRVKTVGNILLSILPVPDDEEVYGQLVCEKVLGNVAFKGVGSAVLPWNDLGSSAMRALSDNTNRIANVMTAVAPQFLDPKTPWVKTDVGLTIVVQPECEDVRRAVMPIVIPDVTKPLHDLISKLSEFKDEASMIPRMVGEGALDPKTLGEYRDKAARGDKYLGQIIRHLDTPVEWFLSRMLEFNLSDPECPAPRIPLRVRALGFSKFHDKTEVLPNLFAVWQRISEDPELRGRYKMEAFARKAVELSGLDVAEFEKSPSELEHEAEIEQQQLETARAGGAANDPATAMQMAAMQADIERKRAQAAAERSRQQLYAAQANKLNTDALVSRVAAVKGLRAGAAPEGSGQKSEVSQAAA